MFEPWSPTVDGVVLPGTFLDLLKEGRFSRVPLVIGHVTEEARMFVYEAFTKSVSKTEADALVRLIWQGKDVAKQIFKMYPWPSPAPKDYRDWFSELGTFTSVYAVPRRGATLLMLLLLLPMAVVANVGWQMNCKAAILPYYCIYMLPFIFLAVLTITVHFLFIVKNTDFYTDFKGTDFVIECPSRHVANLYANKTLPVHRYEFNHVWETRGLWGKNMSFCEG